jgi:rare lipoprotein A
MEPEYAIDRGHRSSPYWQGSRTANHDLRAFPKLNFLASAALLLPPLALVIGCGSKRSAQIQVPAAPAISDSATSANPTAQESAELDNAGPQEPSVSPSARAIYVETGMASWYGPSYNHRKAANGEVYDMNQLTAAHRTIPLNSIARVTNMKTGESVVVRITDRGPFVPDRSIDLSKAAAKRVGVYQHGTARVRIEVLRAPASINEGGRWAVQIGAFDDSESASAMKERLARRYRTAKVLEFAGPRNDWWVRVRVPNDDKRRAAEVAHDNHTDQGGIYLVRLD